MGSLIFVRPVAAEDVKLGDPITFYMADGRTLATHRVTQVDEASQSFKTKGTPTPLRIKELCPLTGWWAARSSVFLLPATSVFWQGRPREK